MNRRFYLLTIAQFSGPFSGRYISIQLSCAIKWTNLFDSRQIPLVYISCLFNHRKNVPHLILIREISCDENNLSSFQIFDIFQSKHALKMCIKWEKLRELIILYLYSYLAHPANKRQPIFSHSQIRGECSRT